MSIRSLSGWLGGVLLALASVACAGDSPQAPLGSNLGAVTDFRDEFPFVDLMKQARDWSPGNTAGCLDCRNPGSQAACLAPNACPTSVDVDADGYVRSLAAGQVVTTIVHAGSAAGRLPAGRYTVRYSGSGTFQWLGASVVGQAPGEFQLDIASSSNNNFGFRLSAVTAGDHPRAIRILPPGGVCAADVRRPCDAATPCAAGDRCDSYTTPGVAERQRFQPRFLANLADYRLLRYMEWMETNNSPVTALGDYPGVSHANWRVVPLEVLIDLGNRTASDIWINLPHLADDALVDGFARQLRDDFRADRRIYVEYGNENWNGIFSQNIEIPRRDCLGYADLAAACQNDAVPGNGIACERNAGGSLGAAQTACFQALLRGWAQRSAQIFARFDVVFAAQARERLVRVVAGQAANVELGRQLLNQTLTDGSRLAAHADVFAIAPYFGGEYCNPANGINPATHAAVYASSAALLTDLRSRALPSAVAFMAAHRALLDGEFAAQGLRLVAYEAGQHLAAVGSLQNDATCNARFDAVNADPGIGALYQDYLSAWRQHGAELAHFYNVGRWTAFGRWGALEYQDQPPEHSAKFSALRGFGQNNACWWAGCTQASAVPAQIFADGFEG